jgi:putative membrane-bound dehydrogenase-like protein
MAEGSGGPRRIPRGRQSRGLAVACAVLVLAAARHPAPVPAAGPIEPAKAPAALVTPDDLQVELFAAEPLLSSPACIDVDARGRVWVCEVVNYRAKNGTRKEGDRILVLEDTDRDGRADKQTVFYQGRDVDSALGICVIGEGAGRRAIVSCAPDVFVLHDDDGDLKADRKEPLFTKTGLPQHDHSVHSFMVGPDGRWYFNFGNYGKAVHDRNGRPVADRFGNAVNDSGRPYREGMVFRCRPDGGDFEVLGHNFRNNYEVAVDSFGTLWQSDNDDDGNRGVRINWVMEYGNYGYKDERTGEGWQVRRTNLEPEIPRRHWHQNDPGVVPNLLLTGGGSPTGICVYEGDLLPERFRGALIHCDAGPNVVRSYRVSPAGGGYAATAEPIVDGAADQWFRPSDACVAPDGSVIVADWYDPGVGGHGMGDVEKGRLYRLASVGSKWSVPPVDLDSIDGAVSALKSPNLCTRATALERLAREPEAAARALEKAFASAADEWLKARLAWAAGMLPGAADAWIAKLAADPSDALRVVAIRMCRAVHGAASTVTGNGSPSPGGPNTDAVLAVAEKLQADPSPAVRREVAIALRGVAGERADRVWAELASRHAAGDRFELEALGVGADATGAVPLWDGRLAAWRTKVSEQWKQSAGREIVWRSRAAASTDMICELIADPSVPAAEALALVRALDFQDPRPVKEAVRRLVLRLPVATEGPAAEKMRAVLPELLLRLDRREAADPAIADRLNLAVETLAGSRPFVDMVRRFNLRQRSGDLLQMAMAEGTAEELAALAAGAALDFGGEEAVRAALAKDDPAAIRLVQAVGIAGQDRARALVEAVLRNADASSEMRTAAVRALARSHAGAHSLLAMAKAGELTGTLPQAAALAVSSCLWSDVRQAAADVLPLPKARGGQSLPSVAELVRRDGKAAAGKAVFAGVGTCAKCHVVGEEGKGVGPNLSGIGAKLTREALYESVLAPSAAISHNYETWTAVLADGRSLTGLLVSQSPERVVIRGADAIDVTLEAGEIEELVRQPVSLMPADLATTLTADELVDLVSWLETLRATN